MYLKLWVVCVVLIVDVVCGVDIVMIVIVDKVYVMIVMVDMIEFGMYLNVVGGDCFGKIEFEVGVLYVGCVFVEFEL